MDLLFPIVAFVGSFFFTFRSLGMGLGYTFFTGYFFGIIRVNYLGLFTTFFYDSGLLGLYLGILVTNRYQQSQFLQTKGGKIFQFIIGWQLFLFLIPFHHYLVQLIALRSDVWMTLLIPVGFLLSAQDIKVLTRWLALGNLLSLAFAIYEYIYGVPSLYPYNALTELIYNSNDIRTADGKGALRIPATFMNAHSYAGTMHSTMSFLLEHLISKRSHWLDRLIGLLAIFAALAGILLTGTRSALASMALMIIVLWALNRFNWILGIVIFVIVVIFSVVIANNVRFQRLQTLTDSNIVSTRLYGSMNENTLEEIFLQYPLGAGLAAGCPNIPGFLQHLAPKGLPAFENEYARIVMGQGWVGLAAWLTWIAYLLAVPPAIKVSQPWGIMLQIIFAGQLVGWASAFIGTAGFISVPASGIVCVQMGILAHYRESTLAQNR